MLLDRIISKESLLIKSKHQPESKKNQYLIFLLYSLLIDLNVEQNIKYVDTLLDHINLNILKSSILVKLYAYLMFKCHNNQKLEKYIRCKIQKVTLKIDSKTDLGKLHRRLEEKHEAILRQGLENK